MASPSLIDKSIVASALFAPVISVTPNHRASIVVSNKTCEYYVDEAGDMTLFDARGRDAIGMQGVSQFFILGTVWGEALSVICDELEELRTELLTDSKYSGIASLAPKRRKTALAFHAKDDHPLVRERVFAVLSRHQFKAMATVRSKRSILRELVSQQQQDPQYKYQPNLVYDDTVEWTFHRRLHGNKMQDASVVFARRDDKSRKDALHEALQRTQEKFCIKHPNQSKQIITSTTAYSAHRRELQIVDYVLWGLQRLYERQDPEPFELVRKHFSMIVDADDVRRKPYGEFYTRRQQLDVRYVNSCLR